ncbi:cytochrome c oxidase assembly protein [Vogesella oryzae]|uniref:cytochrome c oxidase assembly protein n=1 Tax=Vogesella oryzae TaxID=1735285 RepID=UPI0015823AC8|nr:cytochrome c oxidase assembly protein [Vogesella oryzae]
MTAHQQSRSRDNRVLLLKLGVLACVMFVFTWGLIPVYDALCRATGLGKLLQPDAISTSPATTLAAPIVLTFDATVQPGLPWQVRPLVSTLKARPGEFVRVDYEITNASNRRVIGQAIPRYLPAAAAEYVKKLDCFCFAQQAFEPRQTKRFPVVFVVDKSVPAGIDSITLAYTIFDVPGRS